MSTSVHGHSRCSLQQECFFFSRTYIIHTCNTVKVICRQFLSNRKTWCHQSRVKKSLCRSLQKCAHAGSWTGVHAWVWVCVHACACMCVCVQVIKREYFKIYFPLCLHYYTLQSKWALNLQSSVRRNYILGKRNLLMLIIYLNPMSKRTFGYPNNIMFLFLTNLAQFKTHSRTNTSWGLISQPPKAPGTVRTVDQEPWL